MSVVSGLLCFLIVLSPTSAAAASPAISLFPPNGPTGTVITISGTGFPVNTPIYLGWVSENASWNVKAIPVPQVAGINSTPLVYKLATTTSNSSGGFSLQVKAPVDYGGSHAIQAYATNGTAISPVASFSVAPDFSVSPLSGPAGSPINIVATGLGIGVYSTTYCLHWDNNVAGYMSAVSTGGVANFTFYASGTPGTHYISIFHCNTGPGYFNPAQGPISVSDSDPPYIPFYTNYTVTPENVVPQSASSTTNDAFTTHGGTGASSLALVVVSLFAATGLFVYARKDREERKAISKGVIAVAIIAIIVIGGVGLYATMQSHGSTSSTTQTSTGPEVVFTPLATSFRPQITLPVSNVTTGPRIEVTPTISSVGGTITVSGAGFAPNQQLPLVMTDRVGSNLLGFKLESLPFANVTAGADGSFSLTTKAPLTLGGIHYIAAGNLTEHSNGTLFIQRTATISATSGPAGTRIVIQMYGVGWDYNTNIVALDYDNNYLGYACGFNSQGNVTMIITATGAPGIHDIDVYPSIWWGPVTSSNYQTLPGNGQLVNYAQPMMTPLDHPESMPSFHFTFLVTSG
ncbi:MAG: hypothetical protein OK442_02660 [Thaumarchaeota archaeon]|nr:hypothetical protein [Nitrososphaerota archaeon]